MPERADVSDRATVAIAREVVAEARTGEGVICPVCNQIAREYVRRLNSAVARALIELYRAGGESLFIHGNSLPGDTHELSLAARWGLIEEENTHRPDGGRAGHWRLTVTGRAFVENRAVIREYVHVYDGETTGFSGSNANRIADCLGKKFNYNELMEGR